MASPQTTAKPSDPVRMRTDEIVQELRNKLVDIRKAISAKRKGGGYTTLAEAALINVPAKIRYYDVEGSESEYQAILAIFKEVEDDLNTQYP